MPKFKEGREPAQGTMWREGSNNGQVDVSKTGYSGENRNGVDIDQDVPWNYESRNGFFTECTDPGNAGCGANSQGYWIQKGRTRGASGTDGPAYCYWAWQDHSVCEPNWDVIAPELKGRGQRALPPQVTAGAVGGKLTCEFYGEYVGADNKPETVARTDVLWVFAQPIMKLANAVWQHCYAEKCDPSTTTLPVRPYYYSRYYYGIFDPASKYIFSGVSSEFLQLQYDYTHDTDGTAFAKSLKPKLQAVPMFGIKVSWAPIAGLPRFQVGTTFDGVYKQCDSGDQYVCGFRGVIGAPNKTVNSYLSPRPGWPNFSPAGASDAVGFAPMSETPVKRYSGVGSEAFYAPTTPPDSIISEAKVFKWTLYGFSNPEWATGLTTLGFTPAVLADNVDTGVSKLVGTTLAGEAITVDGFSQLMKDMAIMKCCNGEWPAFGDGPDREELKCSPKYFAGSLTCNSELNDVGLNKEGTKYTSICPRYVKSTLTNGSPNPDFIGWGPFAPGSVEDYWITRCGCQLDPLFYSNPNIPAECYDKRCIAKEAYKDYALYSKGCISQNCTINLGNIVAKNSTVDVSAANNCCIVKDGAQATGPYAGSKCEADIRAGGYRCAPSGTEEKQCIRDPANGVVSAADCMEKCGAPAPPMFKCNAATGACTQSPDGTFESMAECVAGCAAPQTKYACQNGAACVPSPTGAFNTITECQASGCGGGVQTKYACVDGSCVPNAAGAYSSKTACLASGCAKPPPAPAGDSNIGVIIGASLGGLVLVVGGIMLAKKFKKKQ